MKFIQRIIDYLKTLISNKTDQDPKFFVGIVCTILWICMVIYHLYSKQPIQSELIWANIGLISACFGLEVMNSIKSNNTTKPE